MQFKTSYEPVEYQYAVDAMERLVKEIFNNENEEMIWFLEHPPIYTAGTSAKKSDLLKPEKFPVYNTGRGGEYTYHGAGQRIAYVMLDLRKRTKDLKKYIYDLEEWIIRSLQHFDINGERRKDRIGVWVIDKNGYESKIAAIGVRVRKWITYHGIALNVSPDLENFSGIIPCGIREYGVTSMKEIGIVVEMKEVDRILKQEWEYSNKCVT